MVVPDIVTFRSCTPGQLEVMSEVSKLLRLLLVMSATIATSERSVSALQSIKTHLYARRCLSASEPFNTFALSQEPHRKSQPRSCC